MKKESSPTPGEPTRAPAPATAAASPGSPPDRPVIIAGMSAGADAGLAERERQFHRYASNHIPWWVRAMWICYWIGAIYYTTRYLVPMVRAYL